MVESTQKVLSDITGIDFSPEERSIQSGFDQSNRSLSKIDQDVVNDTNALQEPQTYGLEESDLKPEKMKFQKRRKMLINGIKIS